MYRSLSCNEQERRFEMGGPVVGGGRLSSLVDGFVSILTVAGFYFVTAVTGLS